MKDYMKPEVEYVKFETECITDIGTGTGDGVSNEFNDDDFS